MSDLFAHGYALIIGIRAYRHLRPLKRAANDAQDLSDILVSYCGYPQPQAALLLDQQATKAAIGDKLDWLARRAGPNHTALIFFAGHGAQRIGGFEPGEYLCPVEADPDNLRASAISNEDLTTALRAIKAGRLVVFLDACHSGGVGEPRDAARQIEAGLSEKSYDQLAPSEGRVVIASCKPDEVSWELKGMRNGVFTHHLLAGLRGEGLAVKEGRVHIFDLFEYVSQAVPESATAAGLPVQQPLLKAHDVTQNFPIALTASKTQPRPRPAATRAAPETEPSAPFIDSQAFQQLLYFARRGQCRLLIGSGVSYEAGMPNVRMLVDALRAEFSEMGGAISTDVTLPEIATALEKVAGRTYLIDLLRGMFDDALQGRPWERGAYPWIARLATSLTDIIYTSNWDDLLKRTFQRADQAVREIRHPEELALMTQAGQAVVKVHRDFESPDGPIVSEADYAIALHDIQQGTAGTLWGHLADQLARFRFVLVGYGLADATLNLIRRVVELRTGTASERRHFLVGPLSPEEARVAEGWTGVRPIVAGASEFFEMLCLTRQNTK